MNTGAFGEGFPYSNFHDLNMDWIIKIAKDFLDQYTHIQEIIEQGEADIQSLTETGLEQLQEKADHLEELLQAWYDEHSEDIADQLADALEDLNDWYTEHSEDIADELADALSSITSAENTALLDFNSRAETKVSQLLETIPADYSTLASDVEELQNSILNCEDFREYVTDITWNDGHYISGLSGTDNANADWTATDYIKLLPNCWYEFNPFDHCQWAVYDDSKQFLFGNTGNIQVFYSGDDAVYLRYSTWLTYKSTVKISYWYFNELIKQTSMGLNDYIIPISNVISGKYIIPSSGEEGSNASYRATDYIPVIPGCTYFVNIYTTSWQFALYDGTKTYVSGDFQTYGHYISIPSDGSVKYIRLSCNADAIGAYWIKLVYDSNISKIRSTYNSKRYTLFWNDGFWYSELTNSKNSNNEWTYTDMVVINPSTLYEVEPRYGLKICFYDADRTFISGTSGKVFKTPSNAYYMRISAKIAEKSNVSISINPTKIVVDSDRYLTLDLAFKDQENTNLPVYILSGTYNLTALTQTDQEGIHVTADVYGIGNPIIYASPNTQFTQFSLFNLKRFNNNKDITIDGLYLYIRNCEYCIHDDMGGNYVDSEPKGYTHRFRNCHMNIDGSTCYRCIGGGFGDGGHITIENCIFSTIPGATPINEAIVNYHSGWDHQETRSYLTVKDCYFIDGTLGLSEIGDTDMSDYRNTVLITNNSLPEDVIFETTNNKQFTIRKWNNEIRE